MVNPNFTHLKERSFNDRVVNLQGGTRSGKTWSVVDYIIDLCFMVTGMEIDITRDTYKALKATAWKDFENRLKQFNIYNPNDHNKTDSIYHLNGNVITYFGSDDHGKVHGKARDILWVNEAQFMDEEVIDQLYPRTRYFIINDFNPALGDEHWLDKYLKDFPPCITTYRDNPHLTEFQIKDIESKKGNRYWWAIYGSGQRAKVEGAVFTNWERGNFPEKYEPIFGQDYGYSNDPSTLVEVYIDERDRKIYAKEHLYEIGLNTDQLAEINRKVCGNRLIIGDSAEARLIDELRKKHRLNIQKVEKIGVSESCVMMNSYKLIVVDSPNLEKELSRYRWADKGKSVPIDDYNHCIDALRYAFIFKAVKPNYGKYSIG